MFSPYLKIPSSIKYLIVGLFFLRLVDGSFFLLFNYYLAEKGYTDMAIADIISYRFLAIGVLAFPLGLFLKGKKMGGFFIFGGLFLPLLSILALYFAGTGQVAPLKGAIVGWGICHACVQVVGLPYILGNCPREYHSEAITLFFLTFSLSIVGAGFFHSLMNQFTAWPESGTMYVFAFLGWLSLFFFTRKGEEQVYGKPVGFRLIHKSYDWGRIFMAEMPTLLIALGAGIAIQFMNLFFRNVHGMSSSTFSGMTSFTFLLVVILMPVMPALRRRFGYFVSIVYVQLAATVCLGVLAATEWVAGAWFAMYIAVPMFVLRQPLMNVAAPVTSELTMYYVGRRNQELTAALNASIPGLALSGQLVSYLKGLDWPYVQIFGITVCFYLVGTVWYGWLVKNFLKGNSLGN